MNIKLALVAVLIAGSVIGAVLPDIVGNEPTLPGANAALASPPPETTTVMALTATGQAAGWNDSLTLERSRDGHFYADVSVDGQTARMLIDTGASVIALTGDDATAMGLSWDDSEVAVVAQGANGPVRGVRMVLPLVELGDFSAQDVAAVIIPEGLQVSLLGQSFLAKIGVVEIAGDAMVLSAER